MADLPDAIDLDHAAASGARYERIGHGYAVTRREDAAIRARIHAALGDARTVVNVGAGTGSYEPNDRHVVAIEPSEVMAGQRSRALAPAIRATADVLPLRDGAVDAAMAILTVHHWDEGQEAGIRELRRVARDAVVVMTFDAEVSAEMWLMRDYLVEVAELDRALAWVELAEDAFLTARSAKRADQDRSHDGMSGLGSAVVMSQSWCAARVVPMWRR